MSGETLDLLMDALFVGFAVAISIRQLVRRKNPPAPDSTGPANWVEVLLTGTALLTAAVGPNILVVATTPGMPGMGALAKKVLLPSIGLLAVAWIAASRLNLARLSNRIGVGVWTGAAATGFLDPIRLTGFHLGLMPGDMPRMFGVMILDRMALGPSPVSDFVGHLYHFWAGACFGLAYTLLVGRFRWWGGLVWGLIIEIGMMTTPPMVVAMDTGYFGVKFGPGLFGTSLVAHVAFGIVLGLLCERYVRHSGTVLGLLREVSRSNWSDLRIT